MLITKADGSTQEFDPRKLTRSLKRAGAKPAEVHKVLAKIEKEIAPRMTTHAIYERAFNVLHELGGHAVASKFSLRRGLLALGPTGFPLEDFIARLFVNEGYQVDVRQQMRGSCAMHEIDVTGHKDTHTFIAEVKFHKNIGYKSDLQVALYSYARFIDLKGVQLPGSSAEGVDTLKIVTNTKFTTAAIEYAECNGIELLSWGYPRNGSLEELIEKHRMYPITILSSLSQHQRTLLMRKGIVLCSDVLQQTDSLRALQIPEKTIEEVVKEAGGVCNS